MAFIDRISQDITKHFYQKTSGAAVFQSTRMPTENPEAYNEYLQGRQLLATRNKEKMLAGLAKFDQALTLDPDFADAYASKAAIYFSLGNLNHINTDSAFRLTEREALKAIRFDENNASAYGLMAAVYRDEYRWEQANTTFQIALRCNPNNAEVNYWYSLMLRSVGLLEEAVTYSTKAVTLDPLSPVILSGHLRNCSYADKTALVKEILRKGELLFSDSFLFFWSAGYHYLHLNDYSRARRELIIARQLNPNVKGISAAVAYTQARMGESAAAKAYLRSLPATADNDTYFAMVYAGLNDRENCLRTLERMATAGKLPIDVKVSPFFRLLHHDPRFKALLQRFGLLNFQIPE
jgi:Tfp pilus assembly protein PilF